MSSKMGQVDPAALLAQTALQAADSFEAKFLRPYEQEQARLRESAATQLQAVVPLREEHQRLMSQCAAVEGRLRSANISEITLFFYMSNFITNIII